MISIRVPQGGGGGISELYNFPYSVQDTEPTPIREGHIWVKSATLASHITKLKILEAVNAGETDGTLMLVVGDLALHSMSTAHTKTSTSGTTLDFSLADTISTTANWLISHLTGAVTSEYKINRPFVYSNIGGVLDIETTYIWDGTNWILLCEKDMYFVLTKASVVDDGMDIYNIVGDTLVKQASYRGGGAVSASGDGKYIVSWTGLTATLTGYMKVYKRSGVNLLSYYDVPLTVTLGGNTYSSKHAKLSKDGNYLVVFYRRTASQYYQTWVVYKNDGSTFNQYYVCTDYTTYFGSVNDYLADIVVSQNGEFVAVAIPYGGASTIYIQYAFKDGETYSLKPAINTSIAPGSYDSFRMALSSDEKSIVIQGYYNSTLHRMHYYNIDYLSKLLSYYTYDEYALPINSNLKATAQGFILFAFSTSGWFAKKIVNGILTHYTITMPATSNILVRTASFNIDMTRLYVLTLNNATLTIFNVAINESTKVITLTVNSTVTVPTGFTATGSTSLAIPF